MDDTTQNNTLTALHMQLIEALAQDAVNRNLLTDPAAIVAFLQSSADDGSAPAPIRKRRDAGHDVNRRERLKAAGQRIVAGVDRAAEFIESWPGIAAMYATTALLAWHRWPILEAMQ